MLEKTKGPRSRIVNNGMLINLEKTKGPRSRIVNKGTLVNVRENQRST